MVAPHTREQRPRRRRELSRIAAGGCFSPLQSERAGGRAASARTAASQRRGPAPAARRRRGAGGEGQRAAPGGGGGTMGAKQSGPAAANGRTRAYSGGDLPSSSGGGGANGTGGRSAGAGGRYTHLAAAAPPAAPGGSAAAAATTGAAAAGAAAPRSRSLMGASGSGARAAHSAFNIPHSSGPYGSQDSVSSTPEEGGRERPAGGSAGPRLVIGSLPAHLSPHLFGGFKCPVCSKFVSSDEMDLHLVMCLTKPRITYNEDVLSKDAGECAICLEELQQGDTIARLPCLCIYHKGCIDEWFEVNRSCPEHPSD
ncbi:E3 ubiquitin-protein ligase ZNRF2 [Eudromia elegans]